MIFQALETSAASLTSWPQQPLQLDWPQKPLQLYFLKKVPDPDDLIINVIKKMIIFCGMDHQKSSFLLIHGTLSDGGC